MTSGTSPDWHRSMEPVIIPSSTDTASSRPLPESAVEQLAELWCQALLANLRRHPIQAPIRHAS